VDGMDLAVELAKVDPSPKVQADVVQHLQFRLAERHVVALLSVAHEETWELVATRAYADDIQDAEIAEKLRTIRMATLDRATEPSERLSLLLQQPADDSGRDEAIAAAIANPQFGVNDRQNGSLYAAQQRAPQAVLQGLRQRLEAGLELPYHGGELLLNLDVTDEGPIVDSILDVSHENRDLNAASVMAGPKTIDALIEKFLTCAQALRAARNDRALGEDRRRLEDRIRGTRAPIFAAAILRKADSDDLGAILSLALLLADHGAEHEDRKVPLVIDPATKTTGLTFYDAGSPP
jgi:hypothetical protein